MDSQRFLKRRLFLLIPKSIHNFIYSYNFNAISTLQVLYQTYFPSKDSNGIVRATLCFPQDDGLKFSKCFHLQYKKNSF